MKCQGISSDKIVDHSKDQSKKYRLKNLPCKRKRIKIQLPDKLTNAEKTSKKICYTV
jgi:hypothetical protein